MPVPYVAHELGHFPSLAQKDVVSDDSETYIPDKVIEKLKKSMREWTARAISGPATYASPGEPPLSTKNVL